MDASFWKDCPDVQIDPEKMGGQPTVGALRLTAESVVECEKLGETAEEIAENFPGTPLDKIKSVLAYYHARQPQMTPSGTFRP